MDAAIQSSFGIQRENYNDNQLSYINNYNDMIFQIQPRLNYDAHKEYRRLMKEYEALKKKI